MEITHYYTLLPTLPLKWKKAGCQPFVTHIFVFDSKCMLHLTGFFFYSEIVIACVRAIVGARACVCVRVCVCA